MGIRLSTLYPMVYYFAMISFSVCDNSPHLTVMICSATSGSGILTAWWQAAKASSKNNPMTTGRFMAAKVTKNPATKTQRGKNAMMMKRMLILRPSGSLRTP